MRASHAERDSTADVLKAGYAEGRLDQQEFDRRMGLAQSAVTQGELQRLIGDLPGGAFTEPAPPPAVPAVYAPHHPVPGPYAIPVRPWMPPPPVTRTNGSAIAALICGVLVLFYGITALPAVILGHTARA